MIDFSDENVKFTEKRTLPIIKLCEEGPQAFWLSAISMHTHKLMMSLRLYATPAPSLPQCLRELGTIIRREDMAQQNLPGLTELSLKKRWELLKRSLWAMAEAIRESQEELEEEDTHANAIIILNAHLECLEQLYEHLCKQGRKEFGVS